MEFENESPVSKRQKVEEEHAPVNEPEGEEITLEVMKRDFVPKSFKLRKLYTDGIENWINMPKRDKKKGMDDLVVELGRTIFELIYYAHAIVRDSLHKPLEEGIEKELEAWTVVVDIYSGHFATFQETLYENYDAFIVILEKLMKIKNIHEIINADANLNEDEKNKILREMSEIKERSRFCSCCSKEVVENEEKLEKDLTNYQELHDEAKSRFSCWENDDAIQQNFCKLIKYANNIACLARSP